MERTVYPTTGRETRSERRGEITERIARQIGATRREISDNVKASCERENRDGGRQREDGDGERKSEREGEREGQAKYSRGTEREEKCKMEREARARGSSFRGSRLD